MPAKRRPESPGEDLQGGDETAREGAFARRRIADEPGGQVCHTLPTPAPNKVQNAAVPAQAASPQAPADTEQGDRHGSGREGQQSAGSRRPRRRHPAVPLIDHARLDSAAT